MAFCEQCGTQLGTGVAFCGSCGSNVTRERQSSTTISAHDAPTDHTATAAQDSGRADGDAVLRARIDDLPDLPEKWRLRFEAIEKAGGDRVRWWRWPDAKRLNWRERQRIYSNFWAFLFGPFYYLYLGMWRNAITLTVISALLCEAVGLGCDALNIPIDRVLWIVSAVIYTHCANISYYRKTVLKLNRWW